MRVRLLRAVFVAATCAAAGLLAAGCTGLSIPGAQPARMAHVGYLDSGPRPASLADHPFSQGLRELGSVDGKNITIDYRFALNDEQRLRRAVAELIGAKVDVLVTGAGGATAVARLATTTIPIVQAVGTDPVTMGFAASVARPGGNVTGHNQNPSCLSGKRLDLLKQAVPQLSTVGVLWDPANSGHKRAFDSAQDAARLLDLKLVSLEVSRPEDFEPAFRSAVAGRSGGLVVPLSGLFLDYTSQLVTLAAANRLPSMSDWGQWAESGGLMAYAANLDDLERHAAVFVDKILRGAKPGDLPIEEPTKFDLVINLKAAEALGLTIPQGVPAQATEVIQ